MSIYGIIWRNRCTSIYHQTQYENFKNKRWRYNGGELCMYIENVLLFGIKKDNVLHARNQIFLVLFIWLLRTVEPALKTTWFKRPPVYKDHFNFLPMCFPLKWPWFQGPPVQRDQRPPKNRPKQHIVPAYETSSWNWKYWYHITFVNVDT